MTDHHISLRAFLIPGGEQISRLLYKDLKELLFNSRTSHLSIYHMTSEDKQLWSIVLVGNVPDPLPASPLYALLQAAQAQEVAVHPTQCVPLFARHLAARASERSWIEQHYPAGKPLFRPQRRYTRARKKRSR